MKKLQINLTDSGNQTESVSVNILDNGDFSAKMVREMIVAKVYTWLKVLKVKHTINRGRSITVHATFDGIDVTTKPIYFGGENGGKSELMAQVKFFVSEVKEAIKG